MAQQASADGNDAPRGATDSYLFEQISAHNHICAVDDAGELWCWGLGVPSVTITPARITGIATPVKAVTTGDGYTCFIDANSSAKCWGYNTMYELGDGSTSTRFAPTQVTGLASGVKAISSGITSTCALLTTNEIACWGFGFGSTIERTNVHSDTIAIAVVGTARCYLRTGGTVHCWGYNGSGELGLGDTTNRTTPEQIPGLNNVDNITAGGGFFCAHKGDNAVACWGYNSSGQLGNGNRIDQSSPVPVPPPGMTSPYRSVHAGLSFTCAMTTTGQVACWGQNLYKQLGDGSTTDRLTAQVIPGISGARALAVGTSSACAVMSDRTLKCWGINNDGRLSVGTSNDESTPRAVVGFATVGTTTTTTTTTVTTVPSSTPTQSNSTNSWLVKRLKGTYGGSVLQSSATNSGKTFAISKKTVTLFFLTGPSAGRVKVTSTNSTSRTIDLYSKKTGTTSVTIAAKNSSLQSLTLTVLSTKHPKSKGRTISLDAYTTSGKSCGKGCVRSPK